ncbi:MULTISPECIES: hypothetical protein [unclassified Shewanella]|uniref:hypothetical protein n=1 Tax=unclassified Shewanella TaxID=196818 RepID=UPI00354FAB71
MASLTSINSDNHLKALSAKLPTMLFVNNWAPSESELVSTYEQVNEYQQQGRLNVDNVTLYQQRLIASLMVLDTNKKQQLGNVLSFTDIWQACFKMFNTRIDQLTVEILIKDFNNLLVTKSTESMYRIITDIDLLSRKTLEAFPATVRSQNITRLKDQALKGSENNQTWQSVFVRLQTKVQLSTVAIFNDFVKHKDEPFKQDILKDTNAFLMAYLKRGHVKNLWVFASSDVIAQLPANQQSICYTLKNAEKEQMIIVAHIGEHIWVQNYKLDVFGFYKLPEKFTYLQSVVEYLIDKKCKYHYMFSRTGLWQYKLSLTLKSATGFSPKRSDYI